MYLNNNKRKKIIINSKFVEGMYNTHHVYSYTLFYKNVVFPAQAEYSYFFFSADFRLTISLCYS